MRIKPQIQIQILTLIAVALLPLGRALGEPWSVHKERLPQLAHKLEENEQAIRHLLEEKKHAEDPVALHEIMRGLVEKHAELTTASKEYEAERLHIRFKHPDLASVVERRYKHYKLRSVDEIQATAGLDGRLDRLKEKVAAIFITPPSPDAIKASTERAPASSSAVDEDGPDHIILTK